MEITYKLKNANYNINNEEILKNNIYKNYFNKFKLL